MPASSEVPLDRGSSSAAPPTESASAAPSAFSVVYIGLFVLLLAYLGSVRLAEFALAEEFQERVDRAIEVNDFSRPVTQQIQERLDLTVGTSRWIRWGGLRVTTRLPASSPTG